MVAMKDEPEGTYQVPKAMTDLIAMHVSKKAAAMAAGVDLSHFGPISLGKRKMSDGIKQKIEIALKDDIKRPSLDVASIPKKSGQGGLRTKNEYNDPPLLKELIAKFNGRRNRAAAAMGFKATTLINDWGSGKKPFDDLAVERVRRALAGEPPPSEFGDTEPDEYKLGIAVTIFPAAFFERAFEAAEALGGKCIFKLQIRTEWVGIFKMQSDKAKLFKRLMARDAMKIACP